MTHPIEVESYRILAERVDLSAMDEAEAAIAARIIHATADVGFAQSLRVGPGAVPALEASLAAGAAVIVDAAMVAAGITRYPTSCYLPRVPTAPEGTTRSAAAFALAAAEHPAGAVFVVGNAPTALFELVEMWASGQVHPAAVIGLPVGFVGAAESKATLWDSGLRSVSITNVGEQGGSAAAAAAFNAIARRVQP